MADLLRQRQAFWQLPTLVLVLEGGGGGGGGGSGSGICRLCATVGLGYDDMSCVMVKPHGCIDLGLSDPAPPLSLAGVACCQAAMGHISFDDVSILFHK